ncbi:MBL fold metallo-hydrolase [Luteolibacter sp. Populi]|uniref:MBL fold metallo-hydrolase n=1 Tax=Luteolibacter sp. Populi TaxID=3230487 RepID=UPI0034668B56
MDKIFTTVDDPAPVMPFSPQAPPAEGWRVTWLGHASFLVQGLGRNLLIDPVFSDYCAPFRMERFRRVSPPACRLEELPAIDAVLLTHSHYDHLDLSTLLTLGKEMPLVIAEGHAAWLGRKGFRNVKELTWFGQMELFPGIQLSATPAQHFTARTPFDRNRGHWCGWLLEGAGVKLWHAGDSGYCPAFREIGERFGPIDFGMIPIGAYSPRWFMQPIHMNPEESLQAFIESRCRRAVAMHWGTFRLTDEPMGEPPYRLKAALEKEGIPGERFIAGAVGQSWEIQRP